MTTGTSLFFLLKSSSRGWHQPSFRFLPWFPRRRVVPVGFTSMVGGASPLSTSAQPFPESEPAGNASGPVPSLSARLSFVFDQMDMIERERAGKDEAFRQIRAWREKKKGDAAAKAEVEAPNPTPASAHSLAETVISSGVEGLKKDWGGGLAVEVVHPWPEWIELMERLLQQNYFGHQEKSEDQMLENVGVDPSGYRKLENVAVNALGLTEEGFAFTRDWATVRTACLNFGRDRFDILRSLSRKDIQILVGHGCPSVDNKVVFSAKLLRKYVHLDEGDVSRAKLLIFIATMKLLSIGCLSHFHLCLLFVTPTLFTFEFEIIIEVVVSESVMLSCPQVCSSCSLRSSCARAYLLTRKEDEARTLDVMRVLLTYGFDPISGSVENKLIMKMKPVKTVIRKLLHEIVKLSAIPIDPNLPPPVIKKPPPKVKQPPPPPKKRVGRDDIEMKKGDWLCPKCDFMNFAKNTECLQCDARRPKRQLLPGEWECPQCNFLNYRRNMACFHCDHKRPPDEFLENQLQQRPPTSPRTRLERVANIQNVTNAWNFDFDDNESDGADVAAFEYADSPRIDEESSFSGRASSESISRFEDEPFEASQVQRSYQRGKSKEGVGREISSFGARTGFDDFDEEEDDIDSYELDISSGDSKSEVSSSGISQVMASSDSDDFSEADGLSGGNEGTYSGSLERASHRMRKSAYNSSQFVEEPNSDDEFSDDSDWNSGASTHSRKGAGGRSHRGSFRQTSSHSENELVFDSDTDDEVGHAVRHKQRKVAASSLGRKNLRKGRSFSDTDDELSFGSDSDDQGAVRSQRGSKRNRFDHGTGRRFSSNLNGHKYIDNPHSGTRERRGGLSNSFGKRDHNDSFRRSRYLDRGDRERKFVRQGRGGDYGGRSNKSWDGSFGRRMNDRDGALCNFDHPRHRERFTYEKKGRFREFDNGFSQEVGFTGKTNNRRRNER
ncbi:Zinc finger protein [Nymphaea thermarum]|nr:Zinc finger protein [Nymphaea thermarum]